jgi:predicted RNA-binding protein YlqC (UPF0109 family)
MLFPWKGGALVKELIEYVARSLVDDPSQVEVTEIRRAGSVILRLQVAQEDKGRVIGRNGRVANAMRSLLRVVGAQQGKRVNLEIV